MEHHELHPPVDDFTEEEVKALHAEDLAAGTHVVGLMMGIFSMGVILYLIIAITVAL